MIKSSCHKTHVVFVTGPSGAGRSTAIRVLEDLGYEAIDNIPFSLVPRLLSGAPVTRPLALGVDTRNRDFSAQAMLRLIDEMVQRGDELRIDLLYMDARRDVLVRRYSETRRRHPMAPAESPEIGIAREQDLLRPIRDRADIVVDSSDFSVHECRAELQRLFDDTDSYRLGVSLQSFSYKRGLPLAVDMIFDVRFLRNPYWEPKLRAHDGRDPLVAAYIKQDARFDGFFQRTFDLIQFLLPAYRDEGKTHFAIGFGCTGGQHRSVALAEELAKELKANGWHVTIRHREIERRQSARPARSAP